MTSACRDLKDTVRVGGRTVVAIGGRMLMISIVSMRLGKLVEKMMYLMGRGIEQEKQKRRSPERGRAARDEWPGPMSDGFH
jgi:hypothetical protein